MRAAQSCSQVALDDKLQNAFLLYVAIYTTLIQRPGSFLEPFPVPLMFNAVYVKGVCAEGSRPSQFVAWVDNGTKRFPWTSYAEGDEIKGEQRD